MCFFATWVIATLGQPVVICGISIFCIWAIYNKIQKEARAIVEKYQTKIDKHVSEIEIIRQNWQDNVAYIKAEADKSFENIVYSWQRKYEELQTEYEKMKEELAFTNLALENTRLESGEAIRVLKSDCEDLVNTWIDKCRQANIKFDEVFKNLQEAHKLIEANRSDYQRLYEDHQRLHTNFTAEECHTLEQGRQITALKKDLSNIEISYSNLMTNYNELQEAWQSMYAVSAKHARELTIEKDRIFQIRGIMASLFLLTKDLDNVCNYEDTGDQSVSDAVRPERFGGTLYT